MPCLGCQTRRLSPSAFWQDRKSTRLNSSHGYISYAVFCLKKKKEPRHCIGYASHVLTVYLARTALHYRSPVIPHLPPATASRRRPRYDRSLRPPRTTILPK